MPYARPAVRQVKPKPTFSKPVVQPGGGGGSSTLNQEGAPGPKKPAPADPNAGIGGGQGSGAGGMGGGAGLQAAVQKLSASPTFQAQVLSSGGQPTPGTFQSPTAPQGQPAWQALAGMGIGGQGSAAANKARLAAELAKRAGGAPQSGPVVAPPPDHISTETSTPVLSFPGAPAPGGAPQPGNPNGEQPINFDRPQLFGGGDPGVRARIRQGLMQQARTPAPLSSAPDPAGAIDGGMGPGSSGDFTAFGGGGFQRRPMVGRVPGIAQAR